MFWIIGTMVLLVAALVFQLGLLAYAMYALLGIILLSRVMVRIWNENLSAKRVTKGVRELNIGDTTEIQISLMNKGPLPIPWILLDDHMPKDYTSLRFPRLKLEGKRQRILMVWGNSTANIRYKITPLMRGFYQFGPVILENGDIFGLDRRFRLAAPPQFVLVYPRTVPMAGYDLASRRPVGEIRLTHRLFEDPTRIAGVRGYERGDPLNRVHWRTTARMGTLYSKVYEPSTIAGATILFDFHVDSFPERGEPMRSELAVTSAMSVAAAVHSLGQQFGLVSNGQDAAERMRLEGWDTQKDGGELESIGQAMQLAEQEGAGDKLRPIIVPPRRGPEQLELVRESLARIEKSNGLFLPDLIDEASGYIPRDTTLIAILSHATAERAVALSALQRQGMAVVVLLIISEQSELEKSHLILAGEGLEVREIQDETDIAAVCQQQFIR